MLCVVQAGVVGFNYELTEEQLLAKSRQDFELCRDVRKLKAEKMDFGCI